MQPRLVAISYPSSPTDDGHEQSTRRSKVRKNYLNFQSKLSGRLRSLSDSWSDIRGHFHSHKRRDAGQHDNVSCGLFDQWFEASTSSFSLESDNFTNPVIGSKWQTLPQPLQTEILKHLKRSYHHLSNPRSQQLWRKDLMSIQATCRAWSAEAQNELYESIQLKPSNIHEWSFHSAAAARKTRILQLRHTLRSNPQIAKLVKHLTLLPENQQNEAQNVSYSDLVASVVMTCPKLESLTTFYVLYTHSFNRLFHAVSTRTKLTRHTWVIGEDSLVQSRAGRRYKSGILSTQQTRLFLQHHAYWRNLETLNMISHNGKGVIEHSLFVRVLNMLPSLKNLYVSSFDANDFSDETLIALPPLSSLTLNNCVGVNEAGLREWAESENAADICKLVLENQNITSLLTISGLFEALTSLEIFRMVQLGFEPGLPLELEVEEPLFKSGSLKRLEWYTAGGQDPEILSNRNGDLPHDLYERVQSWPRSKSSQQFLSSILDFGLPQLQKVILPGYDNLNGLLRWLKHSSWAVQLQAKQAPAPAPTQRDSSVTAASRTSMFSNKRNTLRLSLRPSSPNFDQYDHWRKSPSDHPPLTALAELPERNSTIAQRLATTSAPTTPTALPEPLSPALSRSSTASSTAGYSPTHSDYQSHSETASTHTTPSTTSPIHARFNESSDGLVLVKDKVITPRPLSDESEDDIDDDPAIHIRDERAESIHSRQSSISVLLDQYAETGPVMMSGALTEE